MDNYNDLIRRIDLRDITLKNLKCERFKLLGVGSQNVEVEVKPYFVVEDKKNLNCVFWLNLK